MGSGDDEKDDGEDDASTKPESDDNACKLCKGVEPEGDANQQCKHCKARKDDKDVPEDCPSPEAGDGKHHEWVCKWCKGNGKHNDFIPKPTNSFKKNEKHHAGKLQSLRAD